MSKNLTALCCLLFLYQWNAVSQPEIRAYIDLQIHPTMHVPYSFFGKGLEYIDEKKPPKESWKHQFRNVNYANYLRENKGARIIVNGALTTETIATAKKARKMIVEQIDYVNKFAAENADYFVVAKNPQELRDLVANTDKTVIVHSIEGAKRLVNSQADADFWAAQGVAFITLIHLVDYKNGAAAIKPGLFPALINFKGLFRSQKQRGLTEHGKNAILWLANAGVMTDLTHASDQTRSDALDFMESKGIPPLVTHDLFKPLHNSPRGVSEEEVLRIYKNKGLMALPISGESCKPYRPQASYKKELDSLKKADCYCEGSIDSYKYAYLALKKFVEGNAFKILGKNFNELSESEKVQLSIGFQSDFNGWLNHSRPRYGKQGCYPIQSDSSYQAVDIQGLAHPGLLQSQWDLLESEEVDLEPIRRSSERFLQLWQLFLDKAGSY